MKKALFIMTMAATLAACGTATQAVQTTQLSEQDFETADEANKFSLKMFAQMHKEEKSNENFCFSPLSASWALSMAANGADGTTREQMYETLGFSCNDAEKINAFQQKIIKRLAILDPEKVTVSVANSMWVNENFKIKKEFEKSNTAYYDAAVKNIKFDDAAAKAINDWCSQKTEGKITEIVKEINPQTELFLINALYFNGRWTDTFNKKRTKEEEFTKENGEKIKVQMMHLKDNLYYYEDENVQMVAKPFGQKKLDMLFILPREGVTMDKSVQLLSENLDAWYSDTKMEEVNLGLPRYKAEYSTSLKKCLQSLGMSDAFTPGKANFSALSKEPLFIGDVLQKTFVKVDEEGAEAAAVTSVTLLAMAAGPPKPKNMVINRPFIYIIRERETGNILFIGRNGHPKE